MADTYESVRAERTQIFQTYWSRVLAERERQIQEWVSQPKSNGVWAQILAESLGEWNHALLEETDEKAKQRMVSVLAVARAWLYEREDDTGKADLEEEMISSFSVGYGHANPRFYTDEEASLRILADAGYWARCVRSNDLMAFAEGALIDLIVYGILWLHHATHPTTT